jgi:hypothetical protein
LEPGSFAEQQTTLPFRTDDAILRDLKVIEAWLLDIQASSASMARRTTALIRDLEPRDTAAA